MSLWSGMPMTRMTSITLVALLGAALATPGRAEMVNRFSDIRFWTGSGSNQAALVLDFGGPHGDLATPSSIAWGYRWNGDALVSDMVFALSGVISGSGLPPVVAGSDPRLAVDGSEFFGFGIAVNGFRYDQIGLPAAEWSQTVRQMLTSSDYTVYPALFIHLPSAGDPEAWPTGEVFQPANFGISFEPLGNDGWYAFADTSDDPYPPNPQTISQPVSAVPEPTVAVLAAAAAIAGLIRWRRRGAAGGGGPLVDSPA